MDNMKVIIINGRGSSGKDEIIKFVEKILWKNYNVYNISSMDKIKQAASLLGWRGTKTREDRKYLSDLKRLSIDFNDFPTMYVADRIFSIQFDETKMHKLVFVHIREPEEIEKLLNLLKETRIYVTTLIVNRHDNDLGNSSDDRVNDFEYDYIINNDKEFDVTKNEVKKWLLEKLEINEGLHIE